jgi:hypothetical protein
LTRLLFTLTERAGFGGRRTYVVDVFSSAEGDGGPGRHVRQSRSEHVEAAPRSEYMLRGVTPPHRSSTVRYSSRGPLRGRCGHMHRHIDDALECVEADDAWCTERGGRTDREVYAVMSPGGWRELNADELAAVELYRREMGKRTE